ncbi:MAG: stage III sporulation protein AG [Clostridiales bacterium]|nr:stage III sporulation protein AG [Clostridiales bacterium]
MGETFWKKFTSPGNKKWKQHMLLLFCAGVSLVFLGNSWMKNDQEPLPQQPKEEITALTETDEEQKLEERLETILRQVDGAGDVKVMITLKSEDEIDVAQQTKSSSSKASGAGENTSEEMENEFVILEDSKNGSRPLVVKRLHPETEGVVIVAQGGDDPAVRNSLSQAAEALLNVPAHKIQVLKMKG